MVKYSKETYKNYHFLKECPLCQNVIINLLKIGKIIILSFIKN